uniref:Venom protein family 34 protein 1 n=1 Tax=Lethocerus distinctifemur TaxID=280095 RepID=A0A2K8JLW1_9HEMI|nr:venom protein family 34 protein 1 [Lethocerus distinctifemur]
MFSPKILVALIVGIALFGLIHGNIESDAYVKEYKANIEELLESLNAIKDRIQAVKKIVGESRGAASPTGKPTTPNPGEDPDSKSLNETVATLVERISRMKQKVEDMRQMLATSETADQIAGNKIVDEQVKIRVRRSFEDLLQGTKGVFSDIGNFFSDLGTKIGESDFYKASAKTVEDVQKSVGETAKYLEDSIPLRI